MKRNSTNIQNLHSLLSSKWLISDSSANGLMPDLARLLNGIDPVEIKSEQPYFYSRIDKEFYFDDDDEDLEGNEVDDFATRKNTIAILPIKSTIFKYSQFCGPMGTREMSAYLDGWENDETIDAVLFDIDSGGGQVAGTAEFADRVKKFKKPILAYSDGMICSAAYWIAAATNYIVANEYCDDIGSIGTMAKGFILDGVIEKAGGKILEEYATKSTEKSFSFRKYKEGDPVPYITLELDPINERFHSKMREYRPQLNEAVFTGVAYVLSSDALSNNLIDEIGDKARALEKLNELIDEQQKSNNIKNMSKKNYANIASAIGVDEVYASTLIPGVGAKTSSFNEGQLEAIDNGLAADNSAELTERISTLEASLEKANEEKATAESNYKGLEASLKKALKDNSLDDKGSASANVAELSAKVGEFGKKKDTKPTTVGATNEVVAETEEVVVLESFEKINVNDL